MKNSKQDTSSATEAQVQQQQDMQQQQQQENTDRKHTLHRKDTFGADSLACTTRHA